MEPIQEYGRGFIQIRARRPGISEAVILAAVNVLRPRDNVPHDLEEMKASKTISELHEVMEKYGKADTESQTTIKRVVDNYDNEFKRGIYTEEAKIMGFIRRQKWIYAAAEMFQRTMLGIALLPKYVSMLCLALLSFNVAPFLSLGISVQRLVRRDYGNAGGDVANRAKLNAALDIFYALVLLQSLFVLYWVTLDVMLLMSVSEVTVVTRKQFGGEEWSLTLVDMYRSETRKKFRKDGELPSNWNFITYGVELLQSASGDDDHRWGARILDNRQDVAHRDMVGPTITDQTDQNRQAVVISSGLTVRRETTTIHEQIKKALEHNPAFKALQLQKEIKKYSKSKYRDSYKSRGAKELISQGLLILERLTLEQGNCTEICKDQRLLSKITSPLMRSARHGDFLSKLSDNTTVEMLSKSLTVLSRLLTVTGPEDDTTRLHQKLASDTEAIGNLMVILENDSEGAHELREQALKIMTELALDESFRELDFNKLCMALICIFLKKETNNITEQEPNNNATSQVEQGGTQRPPKLKGSAAEALARLLPVCAARGILSKQEVIDLLNKVHHEILSSKMGTTADTVEIVVENQPQEDADTGSVRPPIQENEKQSEERKFIAAMLSLVVVIFNENMISKEDFASATLGDAAVAKKLKEILQVNKLSTAQCLRIVKLTCQLVIVMIDVKPSCMAHFNEHNFKGTLAEALETMLEVDDCMLFAGNECEVIKPARSLTSLVKEAHELLNTAEEQGNLYT